MLLILRYFKLVFQFNHGLGNVSFIRHLNIFWEWRHQLRNGYTPLDVEQPWITVAAKNFLLQYLKSKTDLKIFEFGTGGSTLFFLKYAKELTSVEHEPQWSKLVSDAVSKTGRIECWTSRLIVPTLFDKTSVVSGENELKPESYGSGDEAYSSFSFERYVKSIDEYPINYFDLVLVDGRSRPACMHHSFSRVKPGGLLILDNAEVDYYLKLVEIPNDFKLQFSTYGALVCTNGFTKTNIYQRF